MMAASDPYEMAGARWNVDPSLLRAVIQTESGGDPAAVSPAGARGLAQMMPATAASLGVDPSNPRQSIDGAARLLAENLQRYKNPEDALRAYNAGTDRARWNNPETNAYVGKVASHYKASPMPQDAFSQMLGQPSPASSTVGPAPASTTSMPISPFDEMMSRGSSRQAAPKPGATGIEGFGHGFARAGEEATERAYNAVDWMAQKTHADHIPGVRRMLDFVQATKVAPAEANRQEYGDSDAIRAGKSVGNMVAGAIAAETGMGALGAAGDAAASAIGGSAGRGVSAVRNLLTGHTDGMETGAKVASKTAAGLVNGLIGGVATGDDLGRSALEGAAGGMASPIVERGLRDASNYVLRRMRGAEPPPMPASGGAGGGSSGTGAQEASAAPDEGSPGNGGTGQPPPNAADYQVPPEAIRLGIFKGPKHAQQEASQILSAYSTGGPTEVISSKIPGVHLTLSQATGNPMIAMLERTRRAQNPAPFTALEAANDVARDQHFQGVIGTQEQLDAAHAARDAWESETRHAVFDNAQPVQVAPIISHVDTLIKQNAGRPTVQAPLERVRDAMHAISDESGNADPYHLWNARKYLNDMVGPRAAGTKDDGLAAAAQLQALKPTIDRQIEQGANGFGDYLKGFGERSRPIDSMEYLQSRQARNPSGKITLSKISTMIGAIEKSQKAGGANAAKSVTPEQLQALRDLQDDMRLAQRIDLGKARGSDTAQNLYTMSRTANMLNGAAPETATRAAGALGGWLLGGGPVGALIGQQAGNAARNALSNRLAARASAIETHLDNALIDPRKFVPPQR